MFIANRALRMKTCRFASCALSPESSQTYRKYHAPTRYEYVSVNMCTAWYIDLPSRSRDAEIDSSKFNLRASFQFLKVLIHVMISTMLSAVTKEPRVT